MVIRKAVTAFRVDPDQLAALREIKSRVGIPVSEQVRRALIVWIAEHGAKPAPKPKKRG
jgi:hypothetical protein